MNVKYFDVEWYLKTYPDVAEAGVDPLIHFEKYGRKEGRIPCNLPALALERELWANAFTAEPKLAELESYAIESNINAVYANRVLVSFYLFSKNTARATYHANEIWKKLPTATSLFCLEELYLLRFDCYFQSGQLLEAKNLLADSDWPESTSKKLAEEMAFGDQRPLQALNEVYKSNGLTILSKRNTIPPFDALCSQNPKPSIVSQLAQYFSSNKVSIIVPAFNAENCITTCLSSLRQQTWKNVEIIVINDYSSDNTQAVVESICRNEPTIRLINNTKNLGAYTSRNIGMKASTGEYLTVMDADDYAHPQKIEKQVLPLLFGRKVKGTVSHWVRCDENLNFSAIRTGRSWVHRNISSLMVKREVLSILGGWDEVTVNADTEFYERLRNKFGPHSIKEILPDVPMSFGRTHFSSLTQNKLTHTVTQYGGVRKQYMDFARAWHKKAVKLVTPSKLKSRPFPVPPIMLKEEDECNARQFARWSDALNEKWYLSLYSDVKMLGKGLHEHFWETGETEGRYPSPLFCPDAYRYKFNLSSNDSPTYHALVSNWNFSSPVEITGSKKAPKENSVNVALFGHSVSTHIFGAERSLLDMAKALNSSANINLTIFLPACTNQQYIEELLKYSDSIVFIPLPWMKRNRAVYSEIVTYLKRRFVSDKVDCVYVNTIMLLEPFLAAKAAKILSVVHVRELVEFDVDLTNILEETPEQSRRRVCESADFYIANSNETSKWLAAPQQTKVIYNCIDNYGHSSKAPAPEVLKVCMISSNVKKKGVYDFFEIAKLCKHNPKIQFTLYGPSTIDVKKASEKFGCSNIKFAGYIAEPSRALAKHDVVLALSNFKESFGRTVAEAMSMGRVVVAYEWGALGELLNEESGCLVEYKDNIAVVATLERLLNNLKLREMIQQEAALRAKALFSRDMFNKRLSNHIIHLIKNQSVDKVRVTS